MFGRNGTAKAFSKLEFSGERTEEMCILLSEQPLLLVQNP